MLEKELDRIAALESKLDKVISYLYKDENTGRKGLVQEMDELRNELNKFIIHYKLTEAVKKAKMSVWGAAGGVAVLFFKWLLEKVMPYIIPHV